MSDRLAQIEARANEALEAMRFDGLGIGYEHMGDMMRDFGPLARDVLALVEIAKAARVLLAEYEEEETEHGFPFNFALRDAHRSLRSALTRLDSGAAEGDA